METTRRIRKYGGIALVGLVAFGVVLVLLLPREHAAPSEQLERVAETLVPFAEDVRSPMQPTGTAASTQSMQSTPPTGLARPMQPADGADRAIARSVPAAAEARDEPGTEGALASGAEAACVSGDPASRSFIPGWQASLYVAVVPGNPIGVGGWAPGHGMVNADKDVVWSGSISAHITRKNALPGFAVLWQAVDATPYRNERVEVSAMVRQDSSSNASSIRTWASSGHTESIPWWSSGSGIPGRVVGPELAGGWRRHSMQVDVPFDSELLFYSVAGNSQDAWVDNVEVSIVPVLSVWGDRNWNPSPASLMPWIPIAPGSFLPTPANLDFEDGSGEVKCHPREDETA